MGRWAQRQRRGGGPGTRPPPTITIEEVGMWDVPLGQVIVAFSAPVTAGDFDPLDFYCDNGSGFFNGFSVAQHDATHLIYENSSEWGGHDMSGSGWQYLGSTPDVVTPQSGSIE